MKTGFTWETLQVLLDSPIAFHRVFATIGGGATAGLFLSQLFYWTPRSTLGGGWVYKSVAEWEEETALTRYEQETIKKKLVKSGLIEVDRRGVPATLHFRIVTEKFLQAISDAAKAKTLAESQLGENQQTEFVEKPQSRGRKTSKLDRGKTANKNVGNQKTITENIKDLREISQKISQQENVDIYCLQANDRAVGLDAFESVTPSADTIAKGEDVPSHADTHFALAKNSALKTPPPISPSPEVEAVTSLADSLIDRATAACKKTKSRLAGYQRQAIRTYPELAKNAVADLESEIRSESVDNAAQCLGGLLQVYLGEKYYEFVKPKESKPREKKSEKQVEKSGSSEPIEPSPEVKPAIESRKRWIPKTGEEVVTTSGVTFVVRSRTKIEKQDQTCIYLYSGPKASGLRFPLEECKPMWTA